ncbi:DUF4214 domain-containing protein [Methylobacterium oxalidis]|uniref:DUF4214 domain-containing protein n=1 Tax=Methylobacterium oxalidis TaxID=944322 RepID=UPI003315E2BA
MTHIVDGNLSDWSRVDRLDRPGMSAGGLTLYGAYESGQYVFALSSPAVIGANTTFWLNTDRNPTTGRQAFAGAETGAEFYVNFAPDVMTNTIAPFLYRADGTLIGGPLNVAYGTGGRTAEFVVPIASLGQTTPGLDLKIDVNDDPTLTLPAVYAGNTLTIKDPASLPVVDTQPLRVGIVYSETSANAYFGGGDAGRMAYSQLFMAAQNQATAAGIPFDLLSEADLKNLATVASYDALVFPSFRNVPAADVAQIQGVLTDAVYKYSVGLITAGDFMTNDAAGAALAGDPYIRMKTLLDVTRVGGASGANVDLKGGADSALFTGYQANEQIRTYAGMSTSWYGTADQTPVKQIATQSVTPAGGVAGTESAVIGTETGGRNVHFANESFLGDNNMLQRAIDYVVKPASGPSLSLQMSRDKAIVASRTDMDQAQELTQVNPGDGSPGIYDRLLPILQQWKQDYNFVGSYYIDVGNGANGQATDWTVSKPYYDQLLAMGNEIGSHSVTHPADTNVLTPAQIQAEFQGSKATIDAQLGISIAGAAVPGAPNFLPAARGIAQYYSYVTGGATLVGAGYPGAIGYLTPSDSKVYIAPDMSFDFTLMEFQKKTLAEAAAAWQQEFSSLLAKSDLPIVVWPWHDYGATGWPVSPPSPSPYTQDLFTNVIRTAYAAGSEFVTLADLAQRVAAFEKSNFQYSFDAATNAVTASVGSSGAGKFALNLGELAAGTGIKSVTGWYAYDNDSVFLPTAGGSYTINLGTIVDDVTRLVDIADRAELTSVTGNGTNLTFSVSGEGKFLVDLQNPTGRTLAVSSALGTDLSYAVTGDQLAITLTGLGAHTVDISLTGGPTPPPNEPPPPPNNPPPTPNEPPPPIIPPPPAVVAQPQNQPYFGEVITDPASVAGEVYALYDAVLGRPSDAGGQEYWTGARNAGLSLLDLANAFVNSAEGELRLGTGDDRSFVQALYRTALGREGEAAGVDSWTAALNQGMSRADVALGFAFSAENLAGLKPAFDAGIFVADHDASDAARLYYGLLDRAPDLGGLQSWTGAMHSGLSDQDAAQGFLNSAEYQAKYASLSEAAFVETLYQNALGRNAEPAGLQSWTAALARGATRAEVAVGIADSAEAQQHLVPWIEAGWNLV